MLEIKITLTADSELLAAVNKFADALTPKSAVLHTPPELLKQAAAIPQETVLSKPKRAKKTEEPATVPVVQTVPPAPPTADVPFVQSTPQTVSATVPATEQTTASSIHASSVGPATAVPSTPKYTLDQISRAGVQLMESSPDNLDKLFKLLDKYGVSSLSTLTQDKFDDVALDLIAMGAKF